MSPASVFLSASTHCPIPPFQCRTDRSSLVWSGFALVFHVFVLASRFRVGVSSPTGSSVPPVHGTRVDEIRVQAMFPHRSANEMTKCFQRLFSVTSNERYNQETFMICNFSVTAKAVNPLLVKCSGVIAYLDVRTNLQAFIPRGHVFYAQKKSPRGLSTR